MDYAVMQVNKNNLEFTGKTLAILSKQNLSILDWEAMLDTFAMAITVALNKFVDLQEATIGRNLQAPGDEQINTVENACLEIADNILENCGQKSKLLDQLKIKKQWNIEMWPRQYLKYDVMAFMSFLIEVKF